MRKREIKDVKIMKLSFAHTLRVSLAFISFKSMEFIKYSSGFSSIFNGKKKATYALSLERKKNGQHKN